MHVGGQGRQRSTADHNALANQYVSVKGGLSDVNVALMRENVGKIRRRKIMKMVEARFVERFSVVHDMTTLLKDQFAKVARENATTTKLITKLCKQVSEFQLATSYDSEDMGVSECLEGYDDKASNTTPVSRLPKLTKIESTKTESADTSRPSSLPQVFRLQNSETEIFSKSKTNNIKRVAYNKSKSNDRGQLNNYPEKVASAKSSTDKRGIPDSSGQRSDGRMSKHSARFEHSTQGNKFKCTEEQTKQLGKRTLSNIPNNWNMTEPENGMVVSKPLQTKQATAVTTRGGNIKTYCKADVSSKCTIASRTVPYKSDSSDDSDESDTQEDRNRRKEIQVASNKDKSKKATPFTGLITPHRQEIEHQIKNRERCIQQPGRKKRLNKTV